MIYLLCAIFLALLITCYIFLKKEIANPAVIFTFAYFISIFCACLNVKEWGINLNYRTFMILLTGGIEFICISFIIRFLFEKIYSKNEIIKEYKKREINISKILLVGLIIYEIVVLILLCVNVIRIAKQFGTFSNYSQALTIYKEHTSYANDAELPNYLTILMKPIIAAAYLGSFIFINNFFLTEENNNLKKIRKNWIYLIYPLIYIIQNLMNSNRGSILNLCVGMFTIAIVVWSIKYSWEKEIKLKTIVKIGIIGTLGMVIFYFSASFVGRINNKNIFKYITYYIGGSIECFNQWVQYPDKVNVINGEYTFARTINDLNKLGITDYRLNNKNYSKFIYYENTMVGNIYTSYRAWMHDWGIAGIIILQAVLAIVINLLYYIIKYNLFTNIRNYLIVLYGFMIYTIFMHPIDSYFYLEFFTIANNAVLITMAIMYYWATHSKEIYSFFRKYVNKKKNYKEENQL